MAVRSGDEPPLHVQTVYDDARATATVIVVGAAGEVANLLMFVDAFARERS